MENGRAALWTMLGVGVGFKTWGMILILANDNSRAAVEWLLLMNWPFFLPILLIGLPAVGWYRLVRVRAKRSRLIREEFQVGEPTAGRADS